MEDVDEARAVAADPTQGDALAPAKAAVAKAARDMSESVRLVRADIVARIVQRRARAPAAARAGGRVHTARAVKHVALVQRLLPLAATVVRARAGAPLRGNGA